MKLTDFLQVSDGLKCTLNGFMSLEHKTYLYDILLFTSVFSGVTSFSTAEDYDAFLTLVENCKKYNISIKNYITCVYKYIESFCKPGHKIPVSFFIKQTTIDYCAKNISSIEKSTLYTDIYLDDILLSERLIRSSITSQSEYFDKVKELYSKDKISDLFMVYKSYLFSKYLALVPEEKHEQFKKLHKIFSPIFIYITSKNNVYHIPDTFKWSHSKFELYDFCPIMFRDQYILNLIPNHMTTNEANAQGTKVHSVYEDFTHKYIKSKTKSLPKLFSNIKKNNEYIEVAQTMPEHLVLFEDFYTTKLHPIVTKTTQLYPEYSVCRPIQDETFSGILDLLVINGTSAVIFDYKTSKLDPAWIKKNNAKYSEQLSFYAALIKEQFPEVETVSAHIFYTRGMYYDVPAINVNIISERYAKAKQIRQDYKLGNYTGKAGSCFLCMHPSCPSRKMQSMWLPDGTRRKPKTT